MRARDFIPRSVAVRLRQIQRFVKAIFSPLVLPKPWPMLAHVHDALAKPPAPEFALFGDSVTLRISHTDVDTRPLNQMIADALKPAQTLLLCQGACSPRVFDALTAAIAIQQSKPATVILPINIRSACPQWDFRPEWQFDTEIQSAKSYANGQSDKPMPIRADPPRDLAGYYAHEVQYPLTECKTIGDFMRIEEESYPKDEEGQRLRRREIKIFHYLFDLDPQNRQVGALKDIFRQVHGWGGRVVAYITPINFESGIDQVGVEFSTIFRNNVLKLMAALAPELSDRDTLADWSESMPANLFFHKHTSTEHLNEVGRALLTRKIVDACHAKKGAAS